MKNIKNRKIIVLFSTGILVFLFCVWQNNDIVVSDYQYRTSLIGDHLNGYKIAQISDLHNKKFGRQQNRIIRILSNETPDIIVITGDIVDSDRTNIETALEFVEQAIKIAPVYFVTGNHEHWLSEYDRDNLLEGMKQRGVTLLDNQTMNMDKYGDEFYLAGLSAVHLSDNVLKTMCSDMDSTKLQIVLAHEPQFLYNYSDADVHLVLSGHAHGGQIRLPVIGGLVAPGQGFFPKYTSGTYKKNSTTMIVSRGLGNSIIPIRVFNRPEVVIITLQKS